MKQVHTIIGTLAMLVLSAGTSYACHVDGTVYCSATGATIPNVTIDVSGTSVCSGPFSGTVTTDSNGYYQLDLPDCNGTYTACVDTTTLPAGDTISGSTCQSFSVDSVTNPDVGVYFAANCNESGCTAVPNCIQSNFNGTGVPQNNFIWFNSIIKVTGRTGQADIMFDGSTITFTVNGNPVTVNVPPAIIHFDSSATTATTTYDDGSGTWITVVPASFTGNVFLSGLMYQLPFNLPGGVNPVTWCGNFSADASGLSFQWQWAAAAYEYPCALTSDPNGLKVKPIDGTSMSAYPNGDHAGTPEYSGKNCVTGGARGGGGSNWTGSYSPTKGAALCPGGLSD